MRFAFFLADCAGNNSWEAHRRETTRMACIAECLHRDGHAVCIQAVSRQFRDSANWRFFKHLDGQDSKAFSVHPAESIRRGVRGIHVAFKCSVGTKWDGDYLRESRLVVAHEYDAAFEQEPRLLKVPFLCHNNIIEHLMQAGLFEDYVTNNLQPIREHFRNGATQHDKPIGFYGQNWPCRKAFCENSPEWADIGFYDHSPTYPAMESSRHARWLCGFKAALALRGDTPKTNLPSLLAMLGIPIVMERVTATDFHPFDSPAIIPFDSWEQVRRDIGDEGLLAAYVDAATAAYVDYWSPAGQAKAIVQKMRDICG